MKLRKGFFDIIIFVRYNNTSHFIRWLDHKFIAAFKVLLSFVLIRRKVFMQFGGFGARVMKRISSSFYILRMLKSRSMLHLVVMELES